MVAATNDTNDVAARWLAVQARVEAACRRANRDPAELTIVAVSKLHPAPAIAAAVAAGVTDLGENYAQELAAKQAELADPGVRWHYIGRLQRNKVKLIAGKVALVHAVDSIDLGMELGKRAAAAGTEQAILIAVNAGEETKGGVAAKAVPALVDALTGIAGVRVAGLMTMPPPADDPEASRPYFHALRELRDSLERVAERDQLERKLPFLSMGMSGDFEVAIEEGATHIRVGTAIFGERPTRA